MIDAEWLGSWIQPQHFERNALHAYRRAFTDHPARLLVLRCFLLERIAENLSRFLTVEAAFQMVYGLYSTDGRYVTESDWRSAEENDRFFRFGALSGVLPEFQLSPHLLTYLQFRKAFHAPMFKMIFEEISGLHLGSSTFSVHRMRRGDFLRPHTDAVENRRLAFVLYLSSHWKPNFGGALHVAEPCGRVSVVEAEYNSIVIFDVSAKTEHVIAAIEPAAGQAARLTIGGWIYEPTS